MPPADWSIWARDDLLPVGSAQALLHTGPHLDMSYNVIPTKSIIIHHNKLQAYVLEVQLQDAELEWFIEGRYQCVHLYCGLPLAMLFTLVNHIRLHIGICVCVCVCV